MPPAVIDLATTDAQLDNGLSVVVAPNHAQPLVSAMITFHAGAFVEDESQSGYSHLLEHMIFEGSSELPDASEFRQRLRALGVLANAQTEIDFVRYYYTLPSENLEPGLELLAQSIRAPQLDAAQLEKEIKVVLSEHDLHDGNHEDVQMRRVSDLLFERYPNRADVGGDRDVVEHATADMLRELHTTYSIPNNAQLVLSGDVEPKVGLALAKRFFGDWPRASDPFAKHRVPEHPKLAANVSEGMIAPVSASRLVVAYQAPKRSQDFRASVAADLLAAVSGVLKQKFRALVSSPEVTSAQIRHFASSHAAMITVELDIGPGYEEAAVERLGDLRNTFAGSISEEQLRTAKGTIWQNRLAASDGNLSLASQLSRDWVLAPPSGSPSYLDTLYDLQPKDLVDLIADYMNERHHAAVLMTDSEHTFSGLGSALERVW